MIGTTETIFNIEQNKPTVIEYLLEQLKILGIEHIFGVPGDYAFPVNDAIMKDKDLKWVGNCNELNATYAADGYARIKGFGAVCTTFGVGELCTLGGIGGAYAENVPVIHLVGMPSSVVMKSNQIMHHTLGTMNFHVYENIAAPTVVGHSYLTPMNAVSEINRVLSLAIHQRKPVYFGISGDYAKMPIEEKALNIKNALVQSGTVSNESTLKEVLDEIKKRLNESKQPIILGGNLVDRKEMSNQIKEFIQKTKTPFAGMMIGKASIDESLDDFIGMYDGKMMNEDVRNFVESSDCLIMIGTIWSDFNTGLFTTNIDKKNVIEIQLHDTIIGNVHYENIEFTDIIEGMNSMLFKDSLFLEDIKSKNENIINKRPILSSLQKIQSPDANLEISTKYLYSKLEEFLQPNDIVVIETGTSMQMNFARFPKGAKCISQPLWGAIGWATPASLGAAIAAPDRRVVLITGEGAFQMTAQEICQFNRFKLKPILFIINNDGYLIERLLCDEPIYEYNDIVQWNYSKLIRALGTPEEDFISIKTKTCGELDEVLARINSNKRIGAFVEMITPQMDAPEYMERHHEVLFEGK